MNDVTEQRRAIYWWDNEAERKYQMDAQFHAAVYSMCQLEAEVENTRRAVRVLEGYKHRCSELEVEVERVRRLKEADADMIRVRDEQLADLRERLDAAERQLGECVVAYESWRYLAGELEERAEKAEVENTSLRERLDEAERLLREAWEHPDKRWTDACENFLSQREGEK